MGKTESMTFLLLIVLAVLPLASQSVPSDAEQGLPEGWIHAPSSKANPALWDCAGRGRSWVISDRGGAVAIKALNVDEEVGVVVPPQLKLTKEMVGRRHLLRTSDGWLIGFDAGEFGGGLWWFSEDGTDSKKLLSNNVHAIYATQNSTFVLAGLAHLGLDSGEVDQFIETPDRVTLRWVANLGGSPEASTVGRDGQIVVASPRGVVRVDNEGKVHTIYRSGEHLTYPTSIVVNENDDIFVAMRFFILRLRPVDSAYRPEWLMPKSCRSFKTVRYVCSCTATD
jgi:hypothetical protein